MRLSSSKGLRPTPVVPIRGTPDRCRSDCDPVRQATMVIGNDDLAAPVLRRIGTVRT